MKNIQKFSAAMDPISIITRYDEKSEALLNLFADQVDHHIQTTLVSELIARYADVSGQLEERNRQLAISEGKLRVYNEHLEELVEEKVKEIYASQIATIHALVKSAEARDDDTGAHIERTSAYCKIIAEKAREAGIYRSIIDDDYPENLAKASPLHDIGKVGIPDAILLKPGRLTGEEFDIMKTHVTIGYETLASVEKSYPGNAFLKLGMEIAKDHQEKWDGSGYAGGLSGEDIPLSARIMALSDVYDALRSKRVYKDGFPHQKAVDIIAEGRGSHFDPLLVDIFLQHHLLFKEIFDRLTADGSNTFEVGVKV